MKTSMRDSSAAGLRQAERIARLSMFVLVGTGIGELVAGQFAGSIAVTADGLDSLSDAAISFIVWAGLRLSTRRPDESFRFGYYKVESYGALLAAVVMIYVGITIIQRSYQAFLDPKPVSLPFLGLVVLLTAGTVSFYRARVMRRIAHSFDLVSLKVDSKNSIKDGSASIAAFASLSLATLGFHEFDAIGGMIVGGYILVVSYIAIKESSLILLDAFNRPEVAREIESLASKTGNVVGVGNLRLRRSGPYIVGYVEIFVDGDMPLREVHRLRSEVQESIKQRIRGIDNITIVALPAEEHTHLLGGVSYKLRSYHRRN